MLRLVKNTATIFLVTTLLLLSSYVVFAAWTEPSTSPPSGNLPASLDIGGAAPTTGTTLYVHGGNSLLTSASFPTNNPLLVECPNSSNCGIGLAGAGAVLGYYFHDNSAAWDAGMELNTAHDLAFRVNQGTKMSILAANGNVGIGTAAPQHLLSVNGNAQLIGTSLSSVGLGFGTDDGVSGWTIGNGLTDSTHTFRIYDNTSGVTRLSIDSNGGVGIGSAGVGTNPLSINVGAGYAVKMYTDPSVAPDYNKSIQMFGPSGAFEGAVGYIGGDGDMYLGRDGGAVLGINVNSLGYVGINTQNPTDALDVNGGIRAGTLQGIAIGGNAIPVEGISFPNASTIQDGGAAPGGFFTINGGSQPVALSEGGAQKLVVLTNGNVGIGTTNPGSLLDVNGISSASEFRLGNLSYARVATLDNGGGHGGGYNFNWNGIAQATPSHDSTGNLAGIGYPSDGSIRFYTDASQVAGTAAPERMRIVNNGNVGIGTTSPSQALSVAGKVYATGGIQYPDGSLQTSAGGLWVSNGSNIYYNTGNVGIGTTNPAYNLDVVGTTGRLSVSANNADYLGTVLVGQWTGANGAGPQVRFQGAGSGFIDIGQDSVGNFVVQGTDQTRLTVTDAGAVGIGTTNPGGTLEVSSSTSSTSLLVTYPSSLTGSLRLLAWGSGVNIDPQANGGNLYFGRDNTFANTVFMSGNVGIGNITPNHLLSVNGSAELVGTATGSVGLGFGTDDGVSGWTIGNGLIDATHNFRIYDNTNGVTRLTIDGSGDVKFTNANIIPLTRTLPLTVNNEVDIGSFAFTDGGGSLRISVTVPSNGYSAAKQYILPIQYGQQNATWETVLPISSSGAYSGNDFALDEMMSGTVLSLRLRVTATDGANVGTAYIVIKQEGINADAFTASTATSAVTAPTTYAQETALTQVGGKVGIGTASPNATLEIYKPTSDPDPWIRNDNAIAGDTQTLSFADHLGPISSIVSTTLGGYLSTLDFDISKTANNPVSALHIDSSGNVGIGTTTPQGTLAVVNQSVGAYLSLMGTPGYDNGFSIGNAGTQTFAINQSPSGHRTDIKNTISGDLMQVLTNYGDIYFNTANGGGTPVLVVKSGNGDVGIGTTSPSQALSVVGTVYTTGGIRYADGTTQTSASQGGLWTQNGTSAYYNTGNVGIGTTNPGAALEVDTTAEANPSTAGSTEFQIHANTTGKINMGLLNAPPWTGYLQVGGGATYPLALNPNGGNVGIGTTGPDHMLTVDATTGTTPFRINSTAASPDWALLTSGATTMGRVFRTGNDLGIDAWTGGGNLLLNSTAGTGNVGIGTAAPGSILTVNTGDSAPQTAASPVTVGAQFGSLSVGDPEVNIGAAYTGGAYGWIQAHYSNRADLTHPLAINPNGGNVGIGTTNPQHLLSVNGSAQLIGTSVSSVGLGFGTDDGVSGWTIGNGLIDATHNFRIYDNTNGATRLTINNSGYVGIGTTTPGSLLQLSALNSSAPTLTLNTSNTATANGLIKWTNNLGTLQSAVADNYNVGDAAGNLEFMTGGANTHMVITSSGNVGIGTTTPNSALDVKGTIYSETGGIKFPDGTIQTTAGGGGSALPPTETVLTSGTGTYTTPANAAYLVIQMVGGGGGGSGAHTSAGPGSTGGATSFDGVTANPGGGAAVTTGGGGAGGTGGTGTALLRIAGGGGSTPDGYSTGGGNSFFGGGGRATYNGSEGNGVAGAANSGAGGGGCYWNAGSPAYSAGGGAGEYAKFMITSLASSYSYAVGGGGSGGTGACQGGAGGSGVIIIDAYYAATPVVGSGAWTTVSNQTVSGATTITFSGLTTGTVYRLSANLTPTTNTAGTWYFRVNNSSTAAYLYAGNYSNSAAASGGIGSTAGTGCPFQLSTGTMTASVDDINLIIDPFTSSAANSARQMFTYNAASTYGSETSVFNEHTSCYAKIAAMTSLTIVPPVAVSGTAVLQVMN
ncbi:hypothetical protein KGO95_01370 [Patescibacteria group bacterium]|nr:hypothetical protein [Patescibacteria group bacterium]